MENEPSASRVVFDIDRCLYHLKRCVRLSPDGTVKPEGEKKMSQEEFSKWVLRERLQRHGQT